MTRDEIFNVGRGADSPYSNLSDGAAICFWLREIAYQLAVMNEREAAREKENQDAANQRVSAILRKVGLPEL